MLPYTHICSSNVLLLLKMMMMGLTRGSASQTDRQRVVHDNNATLLFHGDCVIDINEHIHTLISETYQSLLKTPWLTHSVVFQTFVDRGGLPLYTLLEHHMYDYVTHARTESNNCINDI